MKKNEKKIKKSGKQHLTKVECCAIIKTQKNKGDKKMKIWMNTYTGEAVDTLWEAIRNTIENLIYYHFWSPKWERVEG